MALTQKEQILEAIKRSSRPLICVGLGSGTDGVATALGLRLALAKFDRETAIVSADAHLPEQLKFLPGHEHIVTRLEKLQQFVIALNAHETKVDELSYEMKDGELQIRVSPKTGAWSEKDVRVTTMGYRYDLIITVGGADLKAFDPLFATHPDFFYKTPIVNIDHRPENEQYGQINVVDLTAAACGEVAYHLLENLATGLVDADIATAFLTGLIAKTDSFKSRRVTPATLKTASSLIAAGAQREKIVERLFRTRSVTTLRLWGRALARLKADEEARIVWTLLSQQDFMHAGAAAEDLRGVASELISSSPQAGLIVIFYEDAKHEVRVRVRAERPHNALTLCARFSPEGTAEEARLHLPGKTLVEAERELVAHLKKETRVNN